MKMPSFRGQSVDALGHAARQHAWESCLEYCFRSLYQLPRAVQTSLAGETLSSYLTVFEVHWPQISWPRRLLNDPSSWLTAHDRALPDHPSALGPADASFIEGLDGLLLAHSFGTEDFFGIAASCAFAIGRGIQALANAVWESTDPEGVQIWKAVSLSQDPALSAQLAGHSPQDHALVNKEMEQRWLSVTDWLRASGIQNYSDPVQETLERDLLRWRDREMVLPPPPR
jgi:hypothetical protein